MDTWDINGYTLEYLDDEHIYLVDGVIIPSVTQILQTKFSSKYDNVSKQMLNNAAEKGTAVHKAIEKYCKTGEAEDMKEVRNFKFLQKKYKFNVLGNEVPIILFKDDIPIAAGRLDLVIDLDGKVGGADIKRTATLDKQYLAYQLNLYRIGYRQCYGVEWEFLKGIHLREDTRKFVNIPVNENMAWQLVHDYLEGLK